MRHNWPAIIDELSASPERTRRVEMGSPGSAQVTRTRLVAEWDGVEVRTEGPHIILTQVADRIAPKARANEDRPELAADERREEGRDMCVDLVRDMVRARVLPSGYAERALDALALAETGEVRR